MNASVQIGGAARNMQAESVPVEGIPVAVQAADGWTLHARLFVPEHGDGARTAIFLCATGATQERFAQFAGYLAAHGWNALSFDYRSIGASREAPTAPGWVEPSMRAWAREDLTAMIDWASLRFGDAPIALIGHSIGGQIVPLARNAHRVSALLAVAAQKGWYRLWPDWRRLLVFGFFQAYIPLMLRLFGRVPMGFVGLDDLARGVAEDYARWTLRPDYLDVDGQSLAPAFAGFRAPILSLSFEDDREYAPRPTVERLFEHFYTQAPVWRAHIDPSSPGMPTLGHSGFFESAQCPPGFWQDAEAWLRHAVDGRPAPAFDALPAQRLLRQRDALDVHPAAAEVDDVL
jgi:predicted alpha/beta hydrolase